MKSLSSFINECIYESEDAKIKQLEKKIDDVEAKAEDAEEAAKDAEKEANKAEETIKSEEDFRDYAKNKFEEVFGDDVDEDKMKKVIDGIIKKCGEDWGKAVGVLNKSFGA